MALTVLAMLMLEAGTLTATETITAANAPAPNFVVDNLFGGKQIELADFEDKVVYVDFWASWCGPCLKSFPFMQELHEKYADRGLVIIAINLDQDPQDAHDFLEEHPVTFLVGQNAAADIAERYGVIAMPSSYIVGRDGAIKEVHYGFRSKDRNAMATLVENLL